MSKGIVFALRVAGIALVDCGFNAPNHRMSERVFHEPETISEKSRQQGGKGNL